MNITATTKSTVEQRSGGVCELCGCAPASNIHHRRARGMGGTRRAVHTASWLLHLCGSGTTGCHGYIEAHPTISYGKGWKLRQHQTPSTAPVELAGKWVTLTDDGKIHPWAWDG
jgi:hypothetical protein